MSPAVILKNISFSYNQQPLFQDVSLEIFEGEFIGIIGPNGGGKTTLMKLIMGFLNPTKGNIFLFGGDPKANLNKIAYVPQNLRFDKKFPISVGELVLSGLLSRLSFYGCYRKEDKLLAKKMIKKMRLEDLSERPLGTLSGGQMQRALIARALVSSPKLLLLDEPTANVDKQTKEEIYSTLKNLAGEMTIIMVTHDLAASIELVDRVICCVQDKVTTFKASEVCEHFALGLYHAPLLVDSPVNKECCSLQVENHKKGS
mgnify:CR=1 FL=1